MSATRTGQVHAGNVDPPCRPLPIVDRGAGHELELVRPARRGRDRDRLERANDRVRLGVEQYRDRRDLVADGEVRGRVDELGIDPGVRRLSRPGEVSDSVGEPRSWDAVVGAVRHLDRVARRPRSFPAEIFPVALAEAKALVMCGSWPPI